MTNYPQLRELTAVLPDILKFFELAACIAGLLNWKKLKGTFWRAFPVYLGIIFLCEMVGASIKNVQVNTFWYGTFVIPLEFFFFFWLFSKQPEFSGKRTLIFTCAAIYVLAWMLERFWLQERHFRFWTSSFSYSVGNLLLVILIIRYFVVFINSDAILAYKQNMMFWVSIGILVFYLGTFPFFALRITLYKSFEKIFWIGQAVQFFLNCAMYIIFSLAFIWGKPK